MFGQAGRDVRMVMLHFHQLQTVGLCLFPPQPGREVIRMFIDGNTHRPVIEQAPVQLQVVKVIPEGHGIFQIPDVLRQDSPPGFQQAEGVLQFTAHRQQLSGAGKLRRQQDRLRRIAARATQKTRLAVGDAQHRVVQPVDDVAVVQQVIIGDPLQPPARVLVVYRLRLIAAVARGQHQRPCHALHQQVMQGRVGQHESQGVLTGSDAVGQGFAGRVQHHDGCGPVAQQRRLRLVDPGEARDHGDVARHQGKRLVIAVFTRTQAVDRRSRCPHRTPGECRRCP